MRTRLKVDKTMRKMYNKFYDEMIGIAVQTEQYKNYYLNYDKIQGRFVLDIEYFDLKMREKWALLIDNDTYDIWLNDLHHRATEYVRDVAYMYHVQKRYYAKREIDNVMNVMEVV